MKRASNGRKSNETVQQTIERRQKRAVVFVQLFCFIFWYKGCKGLFYLFQGKNWSNQGVNRIQKVIRVINYYKLILNKLIISSNEGFVEVEEERVEKRFQKWGFDGGASLEVDCRSIVNCLTCQWT